MKNDKKTIGVDAVNKALEILNCFTEKNEALTITKIANITGDHKSRISRISKSLENFGYLRKIKSGEFKIGHTIPRLFEIYESSFNLKNSICKKVDVRDRDALVAAVREAEAIYGPTDMMFNNAGVARLADISTQDPNEWDEMIDVNTKGVMNGIYAVMSDMKARKSGTIVNMSSIAGRKVYEDHTVYCGTKYFVHAISESIRGYLSPHNVRVIVFSPGNIEAEVLNGITDPNTLAAFIALSSS